mgnify:CR=1 FL=1
MSDGSRQDRATQDESYWSDRRGHRRFDVALNCSVREDLDRSVTSLMMKNLSLGGCYVITSFPLPEGSEVSLSLDLPELGREIRFNGLVVWSRAAADGQADGSNGMGVRFSEVDSDDLTLLKRYLTELIREEELE